jgi:hypothetical protein
MTAFGASRKLHECVQIRRPCRARLLLCCRILPKRTRGFAAGHAIRAIIMEHSGALFDINDAENSVATFYCY